MTSAGGGGAADAVVVAAASDAAVVVVANAVGADCFVDALRLVSSRRRSLWPFVACIWVAFVWCVVGRRVVVDCGWWTCWNRTCDAD